MATDGTVTDGPYPVVDVPSREEALEWAAKIAVEVHLTDVTGMPALRMA